MYVKQISVFIENTPGRLAHFTKLLGDNNIDLVSLSVADKLDEAEKVLTEAGVRLLSQDEVRGL